MGESLRLAMRVVTVIVAASTEVDPITMQNKSGDLY